MCEMMKNLASNTRGMSLVLNRETLPLNTHALLWGSMSKLYSIIISVEAAQSITCRYKKVHENVWNDEKLSIKYARNVATDSIHAENNDIRESKCALWAVIEWIEHLNKKLRWTPGGTCLKYTGSYCTLTSESTKYTRGSLRCTPRVLRKLRGWIFISNALSYFKTRLYFKTNIGFCHTMHTCKYYWSDLKT